MDIRTFLAEGRPLIFDGAMGTLYASLPGREDKRCERANIDAPDDILAIHRAYLDAGCKAIKTNTFTCGADTAWGGAAARDIIEAGCRLAIEAAKPYGAYVFAGLGPAPHGSLSDPGAVYIRQADIFLEQGVTHFLVETLLGDEGIADFAKHLKARCPEAFLIVSFAVGYDGFTREGRLGSELFARASALPEVDAVGFNCVSGPHHLLSYIKSLPPGEKPLSVMPNAGYPTVLGRRTVYQGTADYFARKMTEAVQSGAAIVGGCCGTTPEHIEKLSAALAEPLPTREATPSVRTARRAAAPNPFWDKLDSGKRVIAVEFDPPNVDDVTPFLDGVRVLRDAGADIVTIADCPVGRPRADSSLLACKIKRELNMEPLPHMTCRDRNLNATKALLLGLSMEGVHNVLLVTGDPIPTEDRDEVKTVFNFNSRKLARYVNGLGESTLSTPFRVFGALNVNARNFDVQLGLALEKEACGVSGFLTQPVLTPEALENLKRAREKLQGKLLGGIYPIVSHRNACFLNNEISGIRVSPEIIAMYEGKDRDEAEALGIDITVKTIREMAPYTDGTYLMTPFARVEMVAKIIAQM